MPEKITLNVGYLQISDHLALGVATAQAADGKGSFQNFDLVPKLYRGWNPLADDLKAGKLEVAFILAPLAMELFHSGAALRMVLQAHKSGSTVIKNVRANISTVTDFKGKNVLIPHYLSVHHMLLDRMLRDGGLEIGPGKDVVLDVTAPAEIPEIMEWDEEGRVGGFIVAEPFGSQVVSAGYGTEFALSKDMWPNHPCCVVVVREDVLRSNAAVVAELTERLVAAGQFIEANRDGKAAEIGARFLNQDEAVVRRVLTSPPDRVTYGQLFPVIEDFDKMQNYLTGPIQAMSDKINLEKFIETRFARDAGAV